MADASQAPARITLALVAATIGVAAALVAVPAIAELGTLNVTPDALVAATDNLAEVMSAVLGIALTVVAIVVQLAAQRYSARLVDLFMRDRVNIAVFMFLVVTSLYTVLVRIVSAQQPSALAAAGALVLVAISFGILLPYFLYVFAFLQPESIISRMEQAAAQALAPAIAGSPSPSDVRVAQRAVTVAIERIADNCLAAIEGQDRNLALHSVRTLASFGEHTLDHKASLPDSWFEVSPKTFAALSREFYEEIVARRTWVEAKLLMELEHIIRRALGRMSELVSQIAASTRAVGIAAIGVGDDDVVEMVVRFFNTYIRHALNARDVRSVYNTLYHYRGFATALMDRYPHLATRVVEHLIYYGRFANSIQLPFVTVTVAHDVRVLCEQAAVHEAIDDQPLLELFLSLDQSPEGKSQDIALMGVRKAQSILGAFYLSIDDLASAEAIREDMRDETPKRLRTIERELLAVRERRFWEITDRGFNFDWVEPPLRPYVTKFFVGLTVPTGQFNPSEFTPIG